MISYYNRFLRRDFCLFYSAKVVIFLNSTKFLQEKKAKKLKKLYFCDETMHLATASGVKPNFSSKTL